MHNSDTSEMVAVADLTDKESITLAKPATQFLSSFRWCSGIMTGFLAFDLGDLIGVFLLEIEPRFIGVDGILLIIVGDCRPAFRARKRITVTSIGITTRKSSARAPRPSPTQIERFFPASVDFRIEKQSA
jgi:hypothetical protein